jgi:spermidine/putrescine transport system ATP-binding protein
VTVVVRPEHARLAADGEGLPGTVETTVYLGTDTHFHLRLAGGEPFIVRQQSSRGAEAGFDAGTPVRVKIAAGVAQVLRD